MASIVHYSGALEFASSQWKNVSTRAHYTMNEDGVLILIDERPTHPNTAAEDHRQVEPQQQQQLLLSAPSAISSSLTGQKRKLQMDGDVQHVDSQQLENNNKRLCLNLQGNRSWNKYSITGLSRT